MEEQLLDWAIELQALAQAGLTYTHDPFDQERFERIRTIATEMLSVQSPIPVPKLRQLFAEEVGYPTPKLVENIETLQIDWFSADNLPPLAKAKNSQEQIKLCFDAHKANDWHVPFD